MRATLSTLLAVRAPSGAGAAEFFSSEAEGKKETRLYDGNIFAGVIYSVT